MAKGIRRLSLVGVVVAVGALALSATSASALTCSVKPSTLTFSPGLSDATPAVQTIKIKGGYTGCYNGHGAGAGITSGTFSSSFTTAGPYTCTSMLNASGVIANGSEVVKWKGPKKLLLESVLGIEIGTFGAKGVVTSGYSEPEGLYSGGSLSGYSEPKFAGTGAPCGVGSKLKSVKVTFNPVFFN